MGSAGDGEGLDQPVPVNCRGFALDRRWIARTLCAADGGRDVGQLVAAVSGVTHARAPAVAVFGLRRSGRTGNGENPAGASRPPASPAAWFTPASGWR
jgi:hypothetical protein